MLVLVDVKVYDAVFVGVGVNVPCIISIAENLAKSIVEDEVISILPSFIFTTNCFATALSGPPVSAIMS